MMHLSVRRCRRPSSETKVGVGQMKRCPKPERWIGVGRHCPRTSVSLGKTFRRDLCIVTQCLVWIQCTRIALSSSALLRWRRKVYVRWAETLVPITKVGFKKVERMEISVIATRTGWWQIPGPSRAHAANLGTTTLPLEVVAVGLSRRCLLNPRRIVEILQTRVAARPIAVGMGKSVWNRFAFSFQWRNVQKIVVKSRVVLVCPRVAPVSNCKALVPHIANGISNSGA